KPERGYGEKKLQRGGGTVAPESARVWLPENRAPLPSLPRRMPIAWSAFPRLRDDVPLRDPPSIAPRRPLALRCTGAATWPAHGSLDHGATTLVPSGNPTNGSKSRRPTKRLHRWS